MDDYLDADASIRKLAFASGLSPSWTDHTGQDRTVSGDDLRRILESCGVACSNVSQIADSRRQLMQEVGGRGLPPMIVATAGEPLLIPGDNLEPSHARIVFEEGDAQDIWLHEHADGYLRADPVHRIGYHRLQVANTQTTLAIAPPRCFTSADVSGGAPVWGLTAQLYGLRTQGDGGIGTFAGVEALCAAAGLRGADALALSPTHALFSADANHYSPYSPSTRLFRNPLHADCASIVGPARVAAAIVASGVAQQMASLEALPLVDWQQAAAVRMRLLRALFDDFMATDVAHHTPLAAVFEGFCASGGETLAAHARFEALHAHYFMRDYALWDWRSWDPEHRDSRAPGVASFACEHEIEVRFHSFLQWLADASQAHAQETARRAGMRIGLICDLAVGMNAGGSHGWMQPNDLLVGLNIGAPPDQLAPRGQNWGLTTFAPRALRRNGYAPFLATLRAQFRHSGGVRIDHVMGLARLWLVPEGEDASHGAYMAYPFNDMLKLVCLESHRHRAIVIGEDLGTVPHGFRERLEQAGVYGMRVMQFERAADGFHKPEWYAPSAAAMSSTHDIPSVAGWWGGADLKLRKELNQFGPGQTIEGEEYNRAQDRDAMWRAFEDAGVVERGPTPPASAGASATDAAMQFLARSASQLALAPVEDLMAIVEQTNLPGTTREHPNWRRRYTPDARRMLDTSDDRIASFQLARPR
ncbi:MAG: 4-alpha-glucanotransferase [Beijerinckiaceae bacterium]|nr:4-alpha-glucanotransferase [Beijerinckiaceae bacterium]